MEKRYKAAVAYLENIPRFTEKHSLDHTARFAQRIAPAFDRMRVIHVAGTNGKGSVCNFLRALLQAQGYSVLLFTSPHLSDMAERFSLNGETISHARFLEAFDAVKRETELAGQEEGLHHPTYFEFLFLMLLHLCKAAKPDYVILETGLGGLLDATNIFTAPKLTIITRIGLDHCRYLGDTKELIAAQKAGIIKERVPLILQSTEPSTDAVILRAAAEKDAPVYVVSKTDASPCKSGGKGEKTGKKSIDFSYQSHYYSIDLSLQGSGLYQIRNAATAIRAYEVLLGDTGNMLSQKALQTAIGSCIWPCRMEEILPGIVIDGAHNEDGIEAFLASVAADDCPGERFLLYAAAADKDTDAILQRIADSGLFAGVCVTRFAGGRAAEPEALAEGFRKRGIRAQAFETAGAALAKARPKRQNDRLYIAGSLYLAGAMRDLLTGSEPVGEDT